MWSPDNSLKPSTELNLTQQLANSNELKNEINNCIAQNNRKNFSHCVTKDLVYTSGDLHYSIGKSNADISAVKIGDKRWRVGVKAYDTYDFTEFQRNLSFSAAVNDLGYIMQKTNLLTPYSWDISFIFIHEE